MGPHGASARGWWQAQAWLAQVVPSLSEYHPKLGAALESAVLQLERTDPCNTQMPEKKKKQIRNGKAVQASDATTTQQIKAAWSSAPLGSQKRPPLPRKKTFDAAKTCAAFALAVP